MIVNGKDLAMVRGDSESVRFNFEPDTLHAGDTLTMTVRKRWDAPVLFAKSVSASDGATELTVNIMPEDTASAYPGLYVYDVQITWGGSAVQTIIPMHQFDIIPEVTYSNG